MPHAEEVLLAADRFKHAASDKEQVEGYVRLGVAEIVALTWLHGSFGSFGKAILGCNWSLRSRCPISLKRSSTPARLMSHSRPARCPTTLCFDADRGGSLRLDVQS